MLATEIAISTISKVGDTMCGVLCNFKELIYNDWNVAAMNIWFNSMCSHQSVVNVLHETFILHQKMGLPLLGWAKSLIRKRSTTFSTYFFKRIYSLS